MPEVTLAPLAARPSDLNGKTIYVISSWPTGSGSQLDDILRRIGEFLEERFPGARVIPVTKPSAYQTDDLEFWDELSAKADAIVYGAAPSCATTTYAIKYTGVLEKRGLPGVAVIFDNLIEDAKNTCHEIGMHVRWAAVPYPPERIAHARISGIMDDVVISLTSPLTAKERESGVYKPPRPARVACTGTFDEINRYFSDRGLSDGLPIIPPTKARVAAMLEGTSHEPDEQVTATMWPAAWLVTVEKAAVVAVMAGCRPEQMPVVLAMIEAFAECGSAIRSTNSFSYMRVINGPIRREIGMNAGTYALGPGNPTNATLGRFLSLAVTNLGGGQTGVNLMGTQGNVSGYAFCFPENEEESPWESFAVEKGYKAGESTLTMFATGWSHCGNYLWGSRRRPRPCDGAVYLPLGNGDPGRSGTGERVGPPRAEQGGLQRLRLVSRGVAHEDLQAGFLLQEVHRACPTRKALWGPSLARTLSAALRRCGCPCLSPGGGSGYRRGGGPESHDAGLEDRLSYDGLYRQVEIGRHRIRPFQPFFAPFKNRSYTTYS